jgi:hypothetical protein
VDKQVDGGLVMFDSIADVSFYQNKYNPNKNIEGYKMYKVIIEAFIKQASNLTTLQPTLKKKNVQTMRGKRPVGRREMDEQE